LIFDTASVIVVVFVISKSFIFVIISHHLSHAFSAGEPESGEIIFKIQGFSIST